MVILLTVCRYVSFHLSSPLSLSFPSLSPSLPLLSSHSCLSLVWRASPFARGRKGLVSCLYATCTAVARSAAQSDRSTSPLILYGYWYAGRPIRGPLFLFNKRLGLSLPRVLTNQVLDLHEAGDHNNLLKTKSRHLIGQYEYLDSSTILVVTWRDLIGLHSWLQRYKSRIGVTPDPSHRRRNHGGSGGWCPPMFSDSYIARLNFIAPLYQTIFLHPCFLPLANGLACQTSLSYHLSSLVFLYSAPPSFFFSCLPSLSP